MQRLRTMHLFAGAGGGILADVLLGHQPVCAVEINEYCQQVLSARQKDGFIPWFPIFDDVTKFDGRPWRGLVDVVAGGFPCQDISVAGKGAGIDGKQSGLWSEMARIIGEVRPRFAFVENSPALVNRGLGRVLRDLATLGYDCRWTLLGAADVGAPHKRDRFWLVADSECQRSGREIVSGETDRSHTERSASWTSRPNNGSGAPHVANTNSMREQQPEGRQCYVGRRISDCGEKVSDTICNGRTTRWSDDRQHDGEKPDTSSEFYGASNVCDTNSKGLEKWEIQSENHRSQLQAIERADWWTDEPDVGRVANGVANRVDRLKALGNGQVPLCAATAWRMLTS